ncbi:MAG TPA: hypothetical protein VMF69_13825 [Gemmataceae bacterium]|nr:hypothetical protein [Gemmataceae bacterium]
MAESAAHKWGQIIGDLLQLSLREELQKVADRHQLYLDYQRDRPARKGSRVSWQDRFGNSHDLDYVFERGGTDTTIGQPAAFIEVAWRRYTKHSKNKAQEIQGAVLALAETYSHFRPFLGIVLAGEFTGNALAQLRSHAFSVFHIPYADIMKAFASVGIDAAYDEDTPERRFREKIKQYQALSPQQIDNLKQALLTSPRPDQSPLQDFIVTLEASLSRRILGITVLVLHGQPQQIASAVEAIEYLQSYEDSRPNTARAIKYEIDVRYNNGDVIQGIFQAKDAAISFLRRSAV